MKYDSGNYNKDKDTYTDLIEEWYARFPEGVTLPPEYAHFVQDNLLRLLIRLARYKFVARLVRKRDRVLEVGSGSGIGSIFISQHCEHVTGIEVKSTEVQEARLVNQRSNVEFSTIDLFDLDPSKMFDVVFSLDVIEHMPLEQGQEFLSKMAEHVEPSGMLITGTPSIYSFQYQSPESQASHVKCYDQQELSALLDQFFGRTLAFSMNDELVHTGHSKMAWYYFFVSFLPGVSAETR